MPHEYKYPRPSVTVDCVVFGWDGAALSVLLIRRKHDPFAGDWALPGGFIDENEPPAVAAARELKEEANVGGLSLTPVGFFGDPGRDPRGWTVSLAFLALADRTKLSPKAADDASAVEWFDVDALPPTAFDHAKIIDAAVEILNEAVGLAELARISTDLSSDALTAFTASGRAAAGRLKGEVH